MHGRRLDPRELGEEEPDDTEGETYNIYVSREQVLNDLASEVTQANFKSSVPLCVEFFGEDAEDLGGPRRELLQIAVIELVGRVFEKNDRGYSLGHNPAHMTRMYKAAGVIIGLCLLQGGPDMRLFSTTFVEDFMGADDLHTPVGQFAAGMCVTGILKLVRAYPQCMELLRHTPPEPMTMSDMLSMFRKGYSERGSNSRLREEATMSTFIKYLGDVAGGGRVVSLSEIVRFVTCLTRPPPVGFQPVPVIIFQPSSSFLPKAQTCTNTLILPIARMGENPPRDDDIFQKFDLGFKNEYFGVG
ncbi:G2/M phase-specific E3 ubiquitin-protein ligase [Holothuria leucospilota]|uniref:G2/M phase-specific E3 ubiquitin-protein ligase n=1 Tax=Holothuria leucospilota TaxID=206669 RepID=A0A9Q1CTK6_HOLLE|nr:G2/M phase-specific E3 ubiquitin-protein ligase [Holothuria leucospilota]